MAFIRPDSVNSKHALEEGKEAKCKSCEIPVVFPSNCSTKGCSPEAKPNLNKSEQVILEEEFAKARVIDHLLLAILIKFWREQVNNE